MQKLQRVWDVSLYYLFEWVKRYGVNHNPYREAKHAWRGKRPIQLKGGESVSPTIMLRRWMVSSSIAGVGGIHWFGDGMRSYPSISSPPLSIHAILAFLVRDCRTGHMAIPSVWKRVFPSP